MPAKQHLTLRVRPDDLAAINQLAAAHGLSRTEYAVRAMLGRLGSVGLDQRVEDLEQRLERLEAVAYQ